MSANQLSSAVANRAERDIAAVATSTGASPGPTYLASELYVMRSDGTAVRRLTRHERWDGAPAWASDGRTAFFYSQRDGESRIYRAGVGAPGAGSESAGAAPEPLHSSQCSIRV